MNVSVLGGSGFIGTRLVEILLASGHDVRVFDRQQSLSYPNLTTVGDIRDYRALSDALKGCDVAYNLAAEHRDDVRPLSLYNEVNVGGMRNLCLAASDQGINKIVFTSSVAVYRLDSNSCTEQEEPQPFNPYGESKLEAERILQEWSHTNSDRSAIVVRPCVVFGEANRGNVYNLMNQIARRRFLMVGTGQNPKSMAYVGNVAEFLSYCLGFDDRWSCYNYADKPDMQVASLVSLMRKELFGDNSLGPRAPRWLGLLGGSVFDVFSKLTGKTFPISRLRVEKLCATTTVDSSKMLNSGFVPSVALEEALRRTVRSEFKNTEND